MARRHEITGEVFTHQYLWNCATTLLAQPETKSSKDMYYQMAGMVMAYFTFEAYLNFVGSSVEPTAWKDERKFFSKGQCSSTRISEKPGRNGTFGLTYFDPPINPGYNG